jgi:hypothetical protein
MQRTPNVKHTYIRCSLAAAILAICFSPLARGDEGMWLFNNPPKKLLKEKYGFAPGDGWFEHIQRSSVRFNSGGSGSFVSSDGLVMTNHHVGADSIQKLSSKDKNYVQSGFLAKTREEELKCLDLELNVLMSIEDVTQQVSAAVKPGMSLAEAEKARRAAMNTIEQESLQKTGLRSDVVTLYQGGLYHLYRYKKYTDVRLVFAPEMAIAFFGGDPDNFEYPRYDLDVSFFRVYENGKPAKIEHYLKWSHTGAPDGELVFVSGHPGKTDRLDTVAHLEFLRDRVLPGALARLYRREVLYRTYSERSTENARRAQEDLFGVQNSRKAQIGRLQGLQDPSVMDAKRADEKALRSAVEANGKLRAEAAKAWDDVAKALGTWDKIYQRSLLLEQGAGFSCHLFSIARTLVRMAEEDPKPNADRLREYRQSNRESLEQTLFSEAPIYKDLETLKLADSLSLLLESRMGFLTRPDCVDGLGNPSYDELLKKVLAGNSPQERAAQLIQGTTLQDVAVRRKLAKGGLAAIEASQDPMIQLARLVDGPARQVRKIVEQEVDEPLRQAYAKIATARFAVGGTDVYPDATFTLRLAFGLVAGYQELGKQLAPWTTLGGAYQHAAAHGNRDPFELPKSWMERKDRLNLQTPFNFVSTADIIGGNSGSPMVNRKGELVGIVFDGNLQSLVWDFVYTEKEGRALSVHSAAIEETLRKIYDAAKLADELGR